MADPIPTPSTVEAFIDLLRDRLAPPAEAIDRSALSSLLSIGPSTLDQMRALGQIGPRPFRVGGAKSIRWHRGEVLAWLANRDPKGELYTAEEWPPIWQAIVKRSGISR